MKAVLSKSNSYLLDKYSIKSDPLNNKNIMRRAGKEIAQFIIENIYNVFNQKIIVLAGPGDNGGDAIIAHSYLIKYCSNSTLILFNKAQVETWYFKEFVKPYSSYLLYDDKYVFDENNYYLDAIFGIGLNRKINGKYKTSINALKRCPNIISIDIPTGIYSDSGKSAGAFINSKLTLSISNYKIGCFFNEGLEAVGQLINLDVGLRPYEKMITPDCYLLESNDILKFWPKYSKSIYKYSKGTLFVIAGSIGYTGACILSIKAAIKTGTGIVKMIVPKSLNSLFESLSIETITISVDDNNVGYFNDSNIDEIISNIKLANTILFGPGLRSDKHSADWKSQILKSINTNLILDASGFESLILKKNNLNDLPASTILTPHYSEFCQIFGFDITYVIQNTLESVKKIIPLLNKRILVLKGPITIIVTSEAEIYLINIGSRLLATAGTGDVLAGIISSLVSQGISLDNAALLGTYLHSKCSNIYKNKIASNGLIASDLINIIPLAIEKIINEN